jgi:hypothetical protein
VTFRLRPIGGTFNRIQAILSYRATHGPLTAVWEPDVPHFLDTFEPLEGVTFALTRMPGDVVDYGIPADAPADWRKAYAELRPIASIQERVDTFRRTLGDYLAIHVRRTDMTPLARKIGAPHPSDEDYLEWIRTMWKRAQVPVWVACDNGETQRKYEEWLGPWFRSGCVLGGYETHTESDHTIHGNIVDAVVDFFMCVYATECMVQGFGTFSGTIAIMRGLR